MTPRPMTANAASAPTVGEPCRFPHVQRALRMVLKAVGLDARDRLSEGLIAIGWRLLRLRARQLARISLNSANTSR